VVVVGAGDGGVSHYGYIKSKKPRGSDAARKEEKPIVDGGRESVRGVYDGRRVVNIHIYIHGSGVPRQRKWMSS